MNWFKRALMHLMCPEYSKAMPRDEPGVWVAVALKFTEFNPQGREVEKKLVVGLREAYRTARWLALMQDLSMPHPEVGIKWGVRRPREEELTFYAPIPIDRDPASKGAP